MIELASYSCPNEKCKDHGIRGRGNITTSTQYRKNKTHLLRILSYNLQGKNSSLSCLA